MSPATAAGNEDGQWVTAISAWELCPWETPGACELSRPPALLCCHREVSGQWERGSPECAINSLTGCGQCQS